MILLAVRWYLRNCLSYRNLEMNFAERGLDVGRVTLYPWVEQFTSELIGAARPRRHGVRGRWFTGETYVEVSEVWRYVYRAVDQKRQVIDVFVPLLTDFTSARRFVATALAAHYAPTEVVTGLAPALANEIGS